MLAEQAIIAHIIINKHINIYLSKRIFDVIMFNATFLELK